MRLMHRLTLSALCLTALLPLQAAISAPLQLTARADRAVLLATPQQYRLGLKDHPNYDIEAANVTLTFTNTSATPLKLNAFRLPYLRLSLEISGPNSGSVERIAVPMLIDGTYAMSPGDFPVLQPAESLTLQTPVAFPTSMLSYTRYQFQRTGIYYVRFVYSYTPTTVDLAQQTTMEKDSFQGAVASNALTFKVLEAGDAVNGLQMALDVQPDLDPLSQKMTISAYLYNASDHPLMIDAWELCKDGLLLTDLNGKAIPFRGGADASRKVTEDEMYAIIKQGDEHGALLNGGYYPDLTILTEQVGSVGVCDPSGFFRDWTIHGSSVTARALLDMPIKPVAGLLKAPTTWWSGKITSPTVSIPCNPTAYRQAKLKQNLTAFSLELNYTGEQDKPFYALRLQVAAVKPANDNDPFNQAVQITEKEASSLIDYLAKCGALRDAYPIVPVAASPVPPTGYNMVITGGTNVPAPTGEMAIWQLFLGWNLAMCKQLDALQAQLPAGAQQAMAFLQTRISGARAGWETADALNKRITLDLPAGTLADSAKSIMTAINCPTLKPNIAPAEVASPTSALHLCNVTAADAFQYLASAANVKCFISAGSVSYFAPRLY